MPCYCAVVPMTSSVTQNQAGVVKLLCSSSRCVSYAVGWSWRVPAYLLGRLLLACLQVCVCLGPQQGQQCSISGFLDCSPICPNQLLPNLSKQLNCWESIPTCTRSQGVLTSSPASKVHGFAEHHHRSTHSTQCSAPGMSCFASAAADSWSDHMPRLAVEEAVLMQHRSQQVCWPHSADCSRTANISAACRLECDCFSPLLLQL